MKIKEMALIKEELLVEAQYEAEYGAEEVFSGISYPIKMEVEIDQPELIAVENVDGNLILPTIDNFIDDDTDCTYNQIKWKHNDSHTETLIKAEDLAEGERQFSVVNIKHENLDETGDDIQEAEAKNVESTKFQCNSCQYNTKRKRDIIQHIVIHQDPKFKCEKCSYVTRRKSCLNKHLTLKHRDQNEFEFFKCRGCPYITMCKKSIGKHIAMKHEDPQKTTQMEKKTTVAIESSIGQHFLMLDSNEETTYIESSSQVDEKDINEETKLKCYNCSYVSDSMASLMDHLCNKHKKTQWFQCDKCLFAVNRQQSLKDHIISVHTNSNKIIKKKLYICDVCPHIAKKKSHLNQHKLIHKDPAERPMFKCNICPYKSMFKFALKYHVKHVHQRFEYECGECSYACRDNRSLKSHIAKKHNTQN